MDHREVLNIITKAINIYYNDIKTMWAFNENIRFINGRWKSSFYDCKKYKKNLIELDPLTKQVIIKKIEA